MSQQFCLKWNNHMNNMMDVFKNLLSTESMVDVTLACDGLSLKAHKMVLSACSPFFQSLFLENPCKHPIVILKDMKYSELKAIIEFMYHGEVNVAQDQLSALMKTAETLRVKGLAEVTNEKNSQSGASQDEPGHRSVPRTETPPPSKRRRGRVRKRSLSDSNRSDDSNEPKIKQPVSPDIEELSGDVTLDNSSGQFSNMQSQVPMQLMPSHSTNSFHKSSVVSQDPQIEEPASADESEFGVEPAKLLEQTLTTEELQRRSGRASMSSNIEMQRRPRSSTDHSNIPTSMPSEALGSNQQPESPPDIKPELLELDPPMSPVAGPSHSTDNSMMYMDQSSVSSHPGTSYQDSTALVPQDSQPQDKGKSSDLMSVLITDARSLYVPPRKNSYIWNYFSDFFGIKGKAQCRTCLQPISYKTSISNLRKHMARKHPKVKLKRHLKHTQRMVTRNRGSAVHKSPDEGTTIEEEENPGDEDAEDKDEESDSDAELLQIDETSDGKMEDELKSNSAYPKRKSHLWTYYTDFSDLTRSARCRLCSQRFSYKTSISNLKKHLEARHPGIHMERQYMKKSVTQNEARAVRKTRNVVPIIEDEEDSEDDEEDSSSSEETTSKLKDKTLSKEDIEDPEFIPAHPRRKSYIWKYYTDCSDITGKAQCFVCLQRFSMSSISNLKNHIRLKHPTLDPKSRTQREEATTKGEEGSKYEKSPTASELLLNVMNSETPADKPDDKTLLKGDMDGPKSTSTCPKKKSRIWKHFTILSDVSRKAQCRICLKRLSYRTSVTNLTRHMTRKHPKVNLKRHLQHDQEPVTGCIDSEMKDTAVTHEDEEDPEDVGEESASAEETLLDVIENRTIVSESEDTSNEVKQTAVGAPIILKFF